MIDLAGAARREADEPFAVSPPSPAGVAALRGDPRFAEAMDLAARALVDLYQGNRVLNHLLNDRGRFAVALLALDLHCSAGGGRPGLTVTRLQDACARTGVCSPGRTAAVLAVMRLFGLVAPAPAGDRRVRQLVPTERLMAMHRERWRRLFRAQMPVLPEAGQALARLDQPEFLAGFVRVMADMFRSGFRFLEAVPVLKPVAERSAGLMILFSLLVLRQEQALPPGAPVGFAVTAAARRFSVSRAHVRTVLREAEAAGLIVRTGPRGDTIAILPRFQDALGDFFATMFLVQTSCARSALAGTEGMPPSRPSS